jgi:hypothetical protein
MNRLKFGFNAEQSGIANVDPGIAVGCFACELTEQERRLDNG